MEKGDKKGEEEREECIGVLREKGGELGVGSWEMGDGEGRDEDGRKMVVI